MINNADPAVTQFLIDNGAKTSETRTWQELTTDFDNSINELRQKESAEQRLL